ncbi:uncharacterized protein ACNLHF_007163 [Anomaloglossus baeobatrachus]|uniref:uncharacterized protein LOC142254874 n=1 Tax=Anomaloglossus baeobatrachus TaxID=238106 RepID=UPI003F4F7AF7
MPCCVVRGCVYRWKKHNPSISLHSFPKDPKKIKLWLQQTGRDGIDLEQMVEKVYQGKVYDTFRICSLHFTTESYNYDGCRRTLKKDAIPTVFNINKISTNLPAASGPSSSVSEVHTPSVLPVDYQNSSCSSTVRTYRVEVPVVPPKTLSQPTVQKKTLVPVVPQSSCFQGCKTGKKSNSIISEKPSSLTIQLTATTAAKQKHSAVYGAAQARRTSQKSNSLAIDRSVNIHSIGTTMDTQMHSAKFGVSQSRPYSSSILTSSSSCIQPRTSPNSEFEASPHGHQLEQLTPANLQQSTISPVTFLTKTSSSVLTNSNLSLDTKMRSKVTSSITKTSSSTTSVSTSGFDRSFYKTQQSLAIPLDVSETNPSSVLPTSVNVQGPPTKSSLAKKPPSISVVHSPPTSQTLIPDCVPPSKKRKLEENIVFLKPTTASSSLSSVLHRQTSINTGKRIFMPHSAPLSQPSCLIQKPLMVDKGVNTDFFTNKKSCPVATDPIQGTRSIHTQTKIYRNHRKIMCTLLVPCETTDDWDSNLTVSLVDPENIGVSDCSSSSSNVGNDDACEELEINNVDLVKDEILPDSEVDASRPISLGKKQSINIKEEEDSSSGQEVLSTPFKSNITIPNFDNNALKIEPSVKTEEDQYPISIPTQNITNFISYNPKTERIFPIPSEPVFRNPTSWETSALQTNDEQEDPSDSSFHINELSEDEDELFLAPSDDEDDIKRVFQDLASPVENPVEEEKYLVFESCLKKLIMMIPCMYDTECTSPLTHYRKETIGSYLSVEVRCRSGHTRLLWESQPRHGYQPLGNVLLSAAVLLSGSSFLKTQHMFKLLNVKSIDKTTYYKNQSMFLFPAINHYWKEEQKAVIRSIRERALCLAGDQQLDNPGFSPKYSVYSLMDVRSKKICSFSVEPVTPEVTSETQEKIGFQKTMGDLQTMNADVKMIVTDRSVTVQEILKDNYPSIVHQIDLWHLSKSIGNEVLLAAKQKDCEVLYEWVEAIRNHIWWSSCTCCKNPDMLIQKWKSVLHHVTNVHEWGGDSDCKACHHPPLPEEVVNNTNWLEKDSPAYKQLKNIVENKSLLKDLKQLSFLCHTGELEIYHSACLKYRPKTLHFFMDSMVARTQLAALDHNRNVHRVKEVVKNASHEDALGSGTQRLEASKGQKSWIVKTLYEPTCQNFLFEIMNDVIALVREEKTFQ